MNWDERAKEATRGRVYQFRGESWAFIEGSHWMRDQLRTDEAIERVAESLWRTDASCADENAVWADQDYYMKLDYCRSAEAAITALLGEEP